MVSGAQVGGGQSGKYATLLGAANKPLSGSQREAVVEKAAYDGTILTVKIVAGEDENNWAAFLEAFIECFFQIAGQRVAECGATSFWPEIQLTYKKGIEPDEVVYIPAYLRQDRVVIFPGDDIDSELDCVAARLSARNEAFQNHSNLFIHEIVCGRIHISHYSPLSPGAGYTELPNFLKQKKSNNQR